MPFYVLRFQSGLYSEVTEETLVQSPACPNQLPEPSLAGVVPSPPRGLPAAPGERPGPPAQPAPASGPSAPCPELPSPLQLSSVAAGPPAPLHRRDGRRGQDWDSNQMSHAGKIPEGRGPTWDLGRVPLEKLLALLGPVSLSAT